MVRRLLVGMWARLGPWLKATSWAPVGRDQLELGFPFVRSQVPRPGTKTIIVWILEWLSVWFSKHGGMKLSHYTSSFSALRGPTSHTHSVTGSPCQAFCQPQWQVRSGRYKGQALRPTDSRRLRRKHWHAASLPRRQLWGQQERKYEGSVAVDNFFVSNPAELCVRGKRRGGIGLGVSGLGRKRGLRNTTASNRCVLRVDPGRSVVVNLQRERERDDKTPHTVYNTELKKQTCLRQKKPASR